MHLTHNYTNHSLTPYEEDTLKTSTQLSNVVSTRDNKLRVNRQTMNYRRNTNSQWIDMSLH
jgi:hypothetical protein